MIQELGTIISRIDHQFNLPPDIAASLDKYYILHWQGKHLLEQINQTSQYASYPEDILVHQETKYRVKFVNGLTAWYLVNNSTNQYKLSFRKLPKKATGFVLIKKA
jgi:hypothetical protein